MSLLPCYVVEQKPCTNLYGAAAPSQATVTAFPRQPEPVHICNARTHSGSPAEMLAKCLPVRLPLPLRKREGMAWQAT
eukprot:888312-Rhodomonas_salina.3